MNKNQLEVGMLVVYRNGKAKVVTASKDESKRGYQFVGKDNYVGQFDRRNDDMTHKTDPQFDIMKVYGVPTDTDDMYTFKTNKRSLLWERPTPTPTPTPTTVNLTSVSATGENKEHLVDLISRIARELGIEI